MAEAQHKVPKITDHKSADMKIQEFSSDTLQVKIDHLEIDQKVEEIRRKARTMKEDAKVVWLLKSIGFIDLTSLGADDTPKRIQALCAKAANPTQSPPIWTKPLHAAAVCVYPLKLQDVSKALETLDPEHNISIVSVAGGFPSGQYPLETRLREAEIAIETGANEIDIVINRPLALMHQWQELYEELKSFRKVCGKICLKTILATGELSNFEEIYAASMIAMMSGSDFIKTSTGKETVNATLPVGIVMCQAIKDYYKKTQRKVGFKPAGGIKTTQDVLEWIVLVETELGDEWMTKDLFRIGASSVMDNIVADIHKN